MAMTHPIRAMMQQKVKVRGHSVQKLEWKQTDGRTDGRRRLHNRPTSRANAVSKYYANDSASLCKQLSFCKIFVLLYCNISFILRVWMALVNAVELFLCICVPYIDL